MSDWVSFHKRDAEKFFADRIQSAVNDLQQKRWGHNYKNVTVSFGDSNEHVPENGMHVTYELYTYGECCAGRDSKSKTNSGSLVKTHIGVEDFSVKIHVRFIHAWKVGEIIPLVSQILSRVSHVVNSSAIERPVWNFTFGSAGHTNPPHYFKPEEANINITVNSGVRDSAGKENSGVVRKSINEPISI